MRKGNYGIAFAFYAAVAFILALFGQTLFLFLLTAFVIVVEKDEQTAKQNLQACGLVGLQWIISEVFWIIKLPLNWIYDIVNPEYDSFFYNFKKVVDGIFSFLNDAVDIAVLVLVLLAIAKIVKGAEVKLPFVAKFADWAYGIGGSKKCPKCGAPVKGNFCDKCGTKLD